MCLKEIYNQDNIKSYDAIKDYFLSEINFSKKENISTKRPKEISRVWILFAEKNIAEKNNNWKCLQVGQSKENVFDEIMGCITKSSDNNNESVTIYKNSAFYENVCPVCKGDYRKTLYSKIGREYSNFKICFLDVDKYLGLIKSEGQNTNDSERIIEICKNQYAEAKIAYQTRAVYWRQYKSGIDGQTLSYIVNHTSEFKK